MTTLERSFQNDLKFGLDKEQSVLEKLRLVFNDPTIEKTAGKFCSWDFESKGTGCKWELKSRRNTKDKYPTTIIPVHKGKDGDIYFCFGFTDGLYYIKYDRERFSKYNVRTIKIYRTGKYDPPTDHYEIPVGDLTLIQ